MHCIVDIFCGGFSQGEINSAWNGARVEPAIDIDAQGQAGELLDIAWLLNGFEENKEACEVLA